MPRYTTHFETDVPGVVLTLHGLECESHERARSAAFALLNRFRMSGVSPEMLNNVPYVADEPLTEDEKVEVGLLVESLFDIDDELGKWALRHALNGVRAPAIKLMLRHLFKASGRS